MRPRCSCGNIAGFWYSPMIYQKMDYDQYLANHAYCLDCTDLDNSCEYYYIGFHKRDWQWLKKKETIKYLVWRNERLSRPYYDVSHVKSDGHRWFLGRYHTKEAVSKDTEGLFDVLIEEGYYT